MGVDWMDVSDLSFNSLLLLERIQLSWFPGWVPEKELATALWANPEVEWYLRHKCREIEPWLDDVSEAAKPQEVEAVREAEEAVMRSINDLLVYVVDPEIYDRQPFLGWDTRELTDLADFHDKVVVDVGSGTGRLALAVAEVAKAVYAVEPVANLRTFIVDKARAAGWENVHAVDGLIVDVPFHDGFADITMGGHVFGEVPEVEIAEVLRVTRPHGMVIACPGHDDVDDETHEAFVRYGFDWARFEEPGDGLKRKYWRRR
jgi:SAM-dependent methyltransferase